MHFFEILNFLFIYPGYSEISELEEYTEVKCLWLESNAISEIKGLEKMKQLKCLFLQNNLINVPTTLIAPLAAKT